MKKYPFKFLDSYNQHDTDIFFGRDEEVAALYEMISQTSILLVYGASGTGKTSIIQCGLAGRFKSYEWMPLMVRRGSNINASLEKQLTEAGGNEIDDDDLLIKGSNRKLSGLGRLIKGVYINNFKPIYLIFDQFEELYVLGTKEEQQIFIESIKQILNAAQPVKIIFSIREEYLGHLYEFEKAVPQLLRKKLRIEPMTLDKVRDVIQGINNFKDSSVTIKADEVDIITQEIFEKIKGKKKTLTIQLPYLQVFLDKLYVETTGDESRQADAVITTDILKRIGDIGDVLRNFLEEQVKKISEKLSAGNTVVATETIWKILSPFCTLEGTKVPIAKKELSERLPILDISLINAAVDNFVNSRIVNFAENENLYELAHDSLALRIAAKRSDEEIAVLEVRRLINSQVSVKAAAREFFTEKQLLFIEPYLDKFKISEEEQDWITQSRTNIDQQKKVIQLEADKNRQEKSRRKKRQVATVVIFLITLLIFMVFYSYNSRQKERKAVVAQERSVVAEQKTKELLQLVVNGREGTVDSTDYNAVVSLLRRQQNYPLDSLIVPRAISLPISGSKNYDFLVWIDVPSFRRDEIRQVVYKWTCSGFADSVHIGREPSLGFAFGYRGWGYCPQILIDVELSNGKVYKIDFDLGGYLEKR
ncbi:MAG: ATP-binding protein [Chitinophagaceae bacterium]